MISIGRRPVIFCTRHVCKGNPDPTDYSFVDRNELDNRTVDLWPTVTIFATAINHPRFNWNNNKDKWEQEERSIESCAACLRKTNGIRPGAIGGQRCWSDSSISILLNDRITSDILVYCFGAANIRDLRKQTLTSPRTIAHCYERQIW